MEKILNLKPQKKYFYFRKEKFDMVSIIPQGFTIENSFLVNDVVLNILDYCDGNTTCKEINSYFNIDDNLFLELINKLSCFNIIYFTNNDFHLNSTQIIELYQNDFKTIEKYLKKESLYINSDLIIETDYTPVAIRERIFERREFFYLYKVNDDVKMISIMRSIKNDFIVEIGVISSFEEKFIKNNLLDKIMECYKTKYNKGAVKLRLNFNTINQYNLCDYIDYEIKNEYGNGKSKFVLEKVYGKI